MPPTPQSPPRPAAHTPAGHLLVLACSARKRRPPANAPALDIYDGVNFRVLRRFLRQHGWPPGLIIQVLSAKYGLIDATTLIEPYDQRLNTAASRDLNPHVLNSLASLARLRPLSSVFLNLGKDYLPAVHGIHHLFANTPIHAARGGIGSKMAEMKHWLHNLPSKTASLPRVTSQRPYLYFFPDWDDHVPEPFVHETQLLAPPPTTRQYAHEIFGAHGTPYDGLLVSLAQLHTAKGALSRFRSTPAPQKTTLRDAMKIPPQLLLLGDCGAFSYASYHDPPFSPQEAARLYHLFGFDAGASVDHIPLPKIFITNDSGQKVRQGLTLEERRRRMTLTAHNADIFLATCKDNDYNFVPIGVIQALDTQSYSNSVHDYIDMGYHHIALGGLVPRTDAAILEICSAVRRAIQTRTRTEEHNIWLHLFGILRPKLQPTFRLLGVSSFDSASYLRKAWLRSDQNYLAPDGRRWYGTIRVPFSSSPQLTANADSQNVSRLELQQRESRCLDALRAFDGSVRTRHEVLHAVNNYGPLLQRRGEDNHFFEKHEDLLTDRPWTKCPCPVCRALGIDVVVFRGTGRNKRRGFHNTWVFYHKILHNRMPASK